MYAFTTGKHTERLRIMNRRTKAIIAGTGSVVVWILGIATLYGLVGTDDMPAGSWVTFGWGAVLAVGALLIACAVFAIIGLVVYWVER